MNKWFDITARNEGSAEVYIYDEIGGYGVTAKDFISQLRDVKAKNVTVRINSPGGSVFDGLAIYNYLKGLKNVTVQIDGIAASIASIIAMAGRKTCMAANGFVMIHNPSGGVMGESADMREMASVLDKIATSLAQTYAAKTGKTPEECAKWMDDETWFSAEDARAAGLVDEICEAAVFTAKLDSFKKAPDALKPDATTTTSALNDENYFVESPANLTQSTSTSSHAVVVNITNTQPTKMENLIKALADAKFVNSADKDEVKLVEQFNAAAVNLHNEITSLKDAAAQNVEALKKKDEEIASLRAALDARHEADAAAKVDAAVKAGKVKADSRDAWVAKLLKDKDAEALLASLPEPKAAGVEPVKAKVSEKITNLTGLARALAAHKAAYDSENNNNN